jgi:hypothetical protein
MSLARAVLVLLTCQVDAASIVRTHSLSVDAMGEVSGFHSDDANAAQNILAQVEELAQSRAAVDKPKIETIQELAKELEDALEETRKSAQQEVDRNLDAIVKCNTDQAASITKIAASTKVQVGKERQAHADCREKEMKTHAEMVKKCTALKDFLKGLDGPIPTDSGDDEMVDYVVKMDEYWCPKGPIAKEKETACKQADKKHKAEKEKCDELQSQFELGFCTWRVQMMDACYAQTECHDKAVHKYNKDKKETSQLVKKWKTECVALKKISCYVKVWLKDGDVSTVDADQLEECKNLNPPCASSCHIDFKKPEKLAVCPLEEVQQYPGTEEFKTTEYGKFLNLKKKFDDDELYHFIKEPTACPAQEKEEKGPVYSAKWCRLGGDPHVTMFDRSRWHPVFAPGHWWLVNTANSHVKIQATYGGVGVKTNKGWQSRRFRGIPPTAVTSMAFSGKFMKDSVLVIQAPCDWDYDTMKCLSTNSIPRITWNGKVMKEDFEISDPPLSVSNIKKRGLVVKLPDGVVVKMHQWGNWKPATAFMAFNVHIQMPRFSTEICGHCGNYDADWHNDKGMYNRTGALKDGAAGSLCDASVHCKDRLISSETFTKSTSSKVKQCVENKPSDVSYEISDCPEEDMKEATVTCDEEFAKMGPFANEEDKQESYKACLMDACLDKNFAKPDAEDAKEADDEDAEQQ